MKLYIIGNGFDLWHHLPTTYRHFYEIAKAALDDLEQFYSLDLDSKELWSDFENDLGHFDWQQFYDHHDGTDVTSENFKPSEAFGLQDELTEQSDHHVEAIREAFQGWIDAIDISKAFKKLNFPEDAYFITFNYTSTLQSVYGINEEKVFHVHGRAEKFDELIFGHGKTMHEEPELDENGDSNRTMFTDSENAAKYPFYALQKPIREVLEKNHSVFASAQHASEIIVVGHSFNDIDLRYFEELAKWAPKAHWLACCYNKQDEDYAAKQLVRCGIERMNIETFGYADSWKLS